MKIYLNQYSEREIIRRKSLNDIKNNELFIFEGAKFEFKKKETKVQNGFSRLFVSLRCIEGNVNNITIAVYEAFNDWLKNNEVMMPSAVYHGNRSNVLKMDYPPSLSRKSAKDMKAFPVITDVPHLGYYEKESKIELLSGDMATPCVGVFDPNSERANLYFFNHQSEKGYSGISFEEFEKRAEIKIEAPCVRDKMYHAMRSDNPSDDKPANMKRGEKIHLDIAYKEFDCKELADFYEVYSNNRKIIDENREYKNDITFEQAFRIIEEKYLKEQWNEKYGYFMVGPKGSGIFGDWQAGWVGGGMNSYSFMLDGNNNAKRMSNDSLLSICDYLMNANGFSYPVFSAGKRYGDDFNNKDDIDLSLIRKQSDLLMFLCKHLLSFNKEKRSKYEKLIVKLQKMTDCLIRIFDENGSFGQYIDIETAEMIIPHSLSSSTLTGAMVLLYRLTKKERYLEIAKKAGEYYYEYYVKVGTTNGGPGEILQCQDSESCFGILESFILIYQQTKEDKWLKYAKVAADQCATWVMTYDFEFPKGTEFEKHDMKTIGSVFANVQNKHSAPGICTLSGDSLLKLYLYSKDERYLELIKDIAHNITQYLSTNEKPIHSWDGEVLNNGWMCERVNTSDWETKARIGGVFKGSCWCEVSCLLTYNEIPGVLYEKDKNKLTVFDHYLANIVDNKIIIENTSGKDSKVKVLILDGSYNCFLDNFNFKMETYDVEKNATIEINI